jgi:hypothetical protein
MKKIAIITVLLLIIGYFLKDKTLSLNLGDTYYVITYFTLAIYIIYILILILLFKFIIQKIRN